MEVRSSCFSWVCSSDQLIHMLYKYYNTQNIQILWYNQMFFQGVEHLEMPVDKKEELKWKSHLPSVTRMVVSDFGFVQICPKNHNRLIVLLWIVDVLFQLKQQRLWLSHSSKGFVLPSFFASYYNFSQLFWLQRLYSGLEDVRVRTAEAEQEKQGPSSQKVKSPGCTVRALLHSLLLCSLSSVPRSCVGFDARITSTQLHGLGGTAPDRNGHLLSTAPERPPRAQKLGCARGELTQSVAPFASKKVFHYLLLPRA